MIGIICALDIEVKGLKELMKNKKDTTSAKMTFTKGEINGVEVVAVECGVGKVNAAMCTQIMINLFKPACIINSGIAGALSLKLNIGDIVIAKDAVLHDMDTTALGDPAGQIWFNDEKRIDLPTDQSIVIKLKKACEAVTDAKIVIGRIATGDIFVEDKKYRLDLNQKFNADACEMEGGAIAQVCYRNEVPFGIIRSISDSVSENTGMDFIKFRKIAAEKSIKVIANFLGNF